MSQRPEQAPRGTTPITDALRARYRVIAKEARRQAGGFQDTRDRAASCARSISQAVKAAGSRWNSVSSIPCTVAMLGMRLSFMAELAGARLPVRTVVAQKFQVMVALRARAPMPVPLGL